jgi:hypothetical protein
MKQGMASVDFTSRLGKAIQSHQAVVTYPRRDYYRFPPFGTKWLSELATWTRVAARRSGLAKNSPDFLKLLNNLNTILARLDDYSATYDNFADDESRDLFIELLAYRILGPWFVRLSIDNHKFWKLYDSVNPQYRIRKNTARYCITASGTFIPIACRQKSARSSSRATRSASFAHFCWSNTRFHGRGFEYAPSRAISFSTAAHVSETQRSGSRIVSDHKAA